jgi:hypothetical protein
MRLVFEEVMDDCRPVKRDQDARHLVFFGKLVQCQGNDLLLPVTVEEDLLAETGVPQACDDAPAGLPRKYPPG